MNEVSRIPTPGGHSIDAIPSVRRSDDMDRALGPIVKHGHIRAEECAKRYPMALLIATRVAREYGYAIAVHGSQVRDLDLIAVPWTSDARPTIEFVLALESALGGFCATRNSDGISFPVPRAHGRGCWVIHLGAGPYIDLSVVPVIP